MSAALPDFMRDRFGWTYLDTVKTAYAINVLLMTIYSDVHRANHLAGSALDAFFLVYP